MKNDKFESNKLMFLGQSTNILLGGPDLYNIELFFSRFSMCMVETIFKKNDIQINININNIHYNIKNSFVDFIYNLFIYNNKLWLGILEKKIIEKNMIFVDGNLYEIRLTDHNNMNYDTNECYGYIYNDIHTIYLNKSILDNIKIRTLIHEIIHIFETNRFLDFDELIIELLSTNIYQCMFENKQILIDYLKKLDDLDLEKFK